MRSVVASSFSIVGLIFLVARCGGTTTPEPNGGGDASTDSGSGSRDGGGGGKGDGGGGGSCSPACGQGRACCGSACVNTDNDPHNCGGCGVTCTGDKSYCESGQCKQPPCTLSGDACDGGSGSCCGSQCCGTGQLCCQDEGPVSGEPMCFTPTADQPTCPQGCAPLCVSDRDAKTNISPVSDRAVLDALASVPMSTWSYKTDDPSVRHLGPMAQDLHSAFGLGATDRAYDPIDAHGIAFASVKALYEMVKDQDARIDRLEKENARLEQTCGAATPAKRR